MKQGICSLASYLSPMWLLEISKLEGPYSLSPIFHSWKDSRILHIDQDRNMKIVVS
jgi:hypothetical protein